jgi:ribosome-binding protein aMBF1 (putative translation factor)
MKMSKKTKSNITTFDEILDKKYGRKDSVKRQKWERDFEVFRVGVLIEEARTRMGMTQDELAVKCGTNKSYISRIENNSSDIRFSTLLKIIQNGLGGQLKLTLPDK